MARATDIFEILKQNLEDAGCSQKEMTDCMELAQQNRWEEIPLRLRQHKTELLDVMHTNRSQIDCLDYLVYRIGKEYGGKK